MACILRLFVILSFLASLGTTQIVGNKKIMVGYYQGLYKYSPTGMKQPLPSGISSSTQLIESELGDVISKYDVICQSFLKPAQTYDAATGVITETSATRNVREGINGAKGLKKICDERGVKLVISVGGGSAPYFTPNTTAEQQKFANALYKYSVDKGYSGVDIDEENFVDSATYVSFLRILGQKFHSSTPRLTVSIAVGPLYCCYQSRALCGAEEYLDWIFLMLYDGLANGAAFDTTSTSLMWVEDQGQRYCGTTPRITNVAKGACQFIDLSLHLGWPADLLIMGLPSYSAPNLKVWLDIVYGDYDLENAVHDSVGMLTRYDTDVWLPSPEDIVDRCIAVLDPASSVLGVNRKDTSKIVECRRSGAQAGATIRGVGFWQIGFEDARHSELSTAARIAVDVVNNETEKFPGIFTTGRMSTGKTSSSIMTTGSTTGIKPTYTGVPGDDQSDVEAKIEGWFGEHFWEVVGSAIGGVVIAIGITVGVCIARKSKRKEESMVDIGAIPADMDISPYKDDGSDLEENMPEAVDLACLNLSEESSAR